MASGDVVFFDIGETLGAVFDEPGILVLCLQVFSYVPPFCCNRSSTGGT